MITEKCGGSTLTCNYFYRQRADYNDSVSLSNLRMFYTSLWHSLLLPRHHSDKDGEYLSFDGSLTVMKVCVAVYVPLFCCLDWAVFGDDAWY